MNRASRPDLSLVLVCHRSSSFLPRCLESFATSADHAGISAETVVVEQSEDEAESARAQALQPDRFLTAPNRGYAAGLNLGLRSATGRVIAFANPDLEFGLESIAALLRSLDAGWDLVGPQLVLGSVRLPPAELATARAELARSRARRGPRSLRGYLVRYRAEARRLWDSANPVRVRTLSGSLILCRREIADRLGPWPEDYFLYFEETEWLWRARRGGLSIGWVPNARVEHHWGHTAAPTEQGPRFESSRRLYYQRRYGRFAPWILRPPSGRPPCPRIWDEATSVRYEEQAAGGLSPEWYLSASPWGFPAGSIDADCGPLEAVTTFSGDREGRPPLLFWGFDSHARRIHGPFVPPGQLGGDGERLETRR